MVRNRLARLRGKLREEGLDAFLVTSLPNIRYLSLFSGSHAFCIVTAETAVFITDTRYALQSRQEVKGFRRFTATRDVYAAAAQRNLLRGCRHVGFEDSGLTYTRYRLLKKLFPSVSFRPTSDVVEELALVKDEQEIAEIQKAVDISDRTFCEVLGIIRPGVREIDIAAEISYLQRKFGSDHDAFDVIIASGERGAMPHACPTKKRLRRGEFVILDYGCTVSGYGSDLTRTVAVGSVTRRSREIYDAVFDAQCEAIAAVRGGMWAKDLDAVARKSIAARGFGRYFIHSLGHGLGLHVHERPRISAQSGERLRSNSVITVEPGVYIPGFGGVRIEDDVLINDTGCRVLNRAPKHLMVVE
jgi:Xaa-Pro aminopeptidase